MKTICLSSLLVMIVTINVHAQDSTFIKINKWLTSNNFAIRNTFDGSRLENKPAGVAFQQDYKSENDYFNVDVAVKLSQLEFLKNSNASLIVYPKFEWHKSTDSTNLKNKTEAGLNLEFFPIPTKGYKLDSELPNPGWKVAPWIQGGTSVKNNTIDHVVETKLSIQVSLTSNYPLMPGTIIRDQKKRFRARYYPYAGVEFNHIPDLIIKDQTEEFSTFFLRFFAEVWIIPETIQLNIDATHREVVENNSALKSKLPFFYGALNLYPGHQTSLGIGYEYKYGYDQNSKFNLVQISALRLTWKI